MIGFVNCYKPKGVTSFSVVSKIKRIYQTKKVGHLGTLDPMAEGVLPIAVGKATKLFDYFLTKDKWYNAEFSAGYLTNTQDAYGEIIAKDDRVPKIEEVKKTLPNFIGKIEQIPPKFSAKKINGERAYNLARQGKEFDLVPNKVEIYTILASYGSVDSLFKFKIHCSAGTYIRTLGVDIFNKIGYQATMTKLVREASGPFKINEALTLEEIEMDPAQALNSIDKYLPDFINIEVDNLLTQKLLNGQAVEFCDVKKGGKYLVKNKNAILGLAEPIENNILKLKINLFTKEEVND